MPKFSSTSTTTTGPTIETRSIARKNNKTQTLISEAEIDASDHLTVSLSQKPKKVGDVVEFLLK